MSLLLFFIVLFVILFAVIKGTPNNILGLGIILVLVGLFVGWPLVAIGAVCLVVGYYEGNR